MFDIAPREIWLEFTDTKCHVCGGRKGNDMAFCFACYHTLPKHMQSHLWQRFFGGFEEAYATAKRWLIEQRQALQAVNLPPPGPKE
jgi:hypothetical protein